MTPQQSFMRQQSNESIASTMNLLTINIEESINQLYGYNSSTSVGGSIPQCKFNKFDLASLSSTETEMSQITKPSRSIESYEWDQFVDTSQ
eukprot:CAMPEP_0194170258 /NCGR_PEP_ID=MMETSP0154-20130528/4900_1 /TAXON_ID=1049557 /ORGANISM="Thalassiothrix antarctica, Strain L6-D1" /LENGTH=90 /DNA_ID=CAMNT_0038882025 /DNA_START=16 /DNA_END=288 /DNA_ORIENTATION=+